MILYHLTVCCMFVIDHIIANYVSDTRNAKIKRNGDNDRLDWQINLMVWCSYINKATATVYCLIKSICTLPPEFRLTNEIIAHTNTNYSNYILLDLRNVLPKKYWTKKSEKWTDNNWWNVSHERTRTLQKRVWCVTI